MLAGDDILNLDVLGNIYIIERLVSCTLHFISLFVYSYGCFHSEIAKNYSTAYSQHVTIFLMYITRQSHFHMAPSIDCHFICQGGSITNKHNSLFLKFWFGYDGILFK